MVCVQPIGILNLVGHNWNFWVTGIYVILFSPFTQISSFTKNSAVKAGTCIKEEFEQMKREFPFGTFPAGKQGSFTVYKRISGNSAWKRNRARLFASFQYKISRRINGTLVKMVLRLIAWHKITLKTNWHTGVTRALNFMSARRKYNIYALLTKRESSQSEQEYSLYRSLLRSKP